MNTRTGLAPRTLSVHLMLTINRPKKHFLVPLTVPVLVFGPCLLPQLDLTKVTV